MWRSITGRLTLWYGATAFVLVLAAAWVQYRAVERDLAADDDRLLLEMLTALRREGVAPSREPPETAASEFGPLVRVLDAGCIAEGGGLSATGQFPPPTCSLSSQQGPTFRAWVSPSGHSWRILQARLPSGNPGWIEVLLDRKSDQDILQRNRQELAVLLPVALVLSMALGRGIARRGLAPIRTLAERVAEIDARSLHQRVGWPAAPAEIRVLAASFDDLLQRLAGAFGALSQFSADLAHELRTPLHVLRQQAEVALARARSVDEYREVLTSSLEELDRLRRTVDDTLFLARAEDPRASIDRSILEVAAELASITDFLDALAAEKGLRLEVDAPPQLHVEADRTLFRRAVVNLVTNSIRHTPADGVIRLHACTEGGETVVSVRDTGAGISAAALPHVFDRHYRAPTTPGYEGTGLGLSIVRGIMALHGGSAELESEPGQGTLATLRFPKREARTPKSPA